VRRLQIQGRRFCNLRTLAGPFVVARTGTGTDSRDMTSAERPNPYEVSLADLEKQAHVPFEDQTTAQPTAVRPDTDTDGDETRRQLHLAGGA